MRKVLVVFAVLGALALLASPASALTLPGGNYQGSLEDFSCLYDTSGNPIGLPTSTYVPGSPPVYVPNVVPVAGDTSKSIFYFKNLIDTTTGATPYDSSTSNTLTGTLTDLTICKVTQTTATNYVIQFMPSTAALQGGKYGGDVAIYQASSKQTENGVADPANGGNISSSLPTAAGGGVSLANPLYGPNQWTGSSFPGITSGTLQLDAELVNLNDLYNAGFLGSDLVYGVLLDPRTVLAETFDVSTSTAGSGTGYLHVEDGAGDYGLAEGASDTSLIPGYEFVGSGLSVEVQLGFAIYTPELHENPALPATFGEWTIVGTNYTGDGYWPENSSDPISFGVIPEPMTMSLLGLGLAGLIARRRKAA